MDEEFDAQALPPITQGDIVVRRHWLNDRWYLSINDVIATLVDTTAPRQYWADTQKRIQAESGSNPEDWEAFKAQIIHVKAMARDGRMRLTDFADTRTMLRIVQSVSGPKAEVIKLWLAKVGKQRLDQAAAEMTEDQFRILLFGDATQKVQMLSQIARNSGVKTPRQIALFHDARFEGLYDGMTQADIAASWGLPAETNVYEWMQDIELGPNIFALTLAKDLLTRAPVNSAAAANAVSRKADSAVRGAIIAAGGTLPEYMHPADQPIGALIEAEQRRIGDQQRFLPDHDAGDDDE